MVSDESRARNLRIGAKDIGSNLLQTGISIIMGWIILLVCNFVIQPIIHPGGDETFWVMLLLGLSLTSWGVVKKGKTISTRIGSIDRKILLQIGVVVTIIWVIILVQREGPLDLGLPKLYVKLGHTNEGVPIFAFFPAYLLIVGFPVLGLILIVSGIILKSINRSKSHAMFLGCENNFEHRSINSLIECDPAVICVCVGLNFNFGFGSRSRWWN